MGRLGAVKSYRVYVRKPGSIVWTYCDTYEGAALTMMAERLARVEFPGCSVKHHDAALHANVGVYARESAGERVEL